MKVEDDVFVALAILSGIVVIFGVLLNGLVCITFVKYRCLLKGGHTLVFSMAVTDLLCSAVAVPMSFMANIKKKWLFEESGCTINAFIVTWCGLLSITHLAALAYSRYEAISLQQNKLTVSKKVIGVVFALWLYTFVFAIAPVAGWSKYSLEEIGTSCSVDWKSPGDKSISYIACLFCGCFALPIAVILISYYKFYKALKKMTQKSSKTWGCKSTLARKTAKIEKKMANIFLVMIAAFLVAWTPYAVVSLISVCGKSSWLSPLSEAIPAYLAKLSFVYNPVFYFLMYKRFRRKAVCLFLYPREQTTSDTSKYFTTDKAESYKLRYLLKAKGDFITKENE